MPAWRSDVVESRGAAKRRLELGQALATDRLVRASPRGAPPPDA